MTRIVQTDARLPVAQLPEALRIFLLERGGPDDEIVDVLEWRVGRLDDDQFDFEIRCTLKRPQSFEDRAREAADEIASQIATCHERVYCPTCGALTGERCHGVVQTGRTLKSPHDQRLRAAGIYLR